MKKAIAIIVSLLFVLSVAGLSFAAEKAVKATTPAPTEEKAMEKKAPAKVKWLTGEVSAVDAAAMTLTVKGKKAEVALTVNDKTKIMMGKEKKALADVKVMLFGAVMYTIHEPGSNGSLLSALVTKMSP